MGPLPAAAAAAAAAGALPAEGPLGIATNGSPSMPELLPSSPLLVAAHCGELGLPLLPPRCLAPPPAPPPQHRRRRLFPRAGVQGCVWAACARDEGAEASLPDQAAVRHVGHTAAVKEPARRAGQVWCVPACVPACLNACLRALWHVCLFEVLLCMAPMWRRACQLAAIGCWRCLWMYRTCAYSWVPVAGGVVPWCCTLPVRWQLRNPL